VWTNTLKWMPICWRVTSNWKRKEEDRGPAAGQNFQPPDGLAPAALVPGRRGPAPALPPVLACTTEQCGWSSAHEIRRGVTTGSCAEFDRSKFVLCGGVRPRPPWFQSQADSTASQYAGELLNRALDTVNIGACPSVERTGCSRCSWNICKRLCAYEAFMETNSSHTCIVANSVVSNNS
jgi:hypothetical protein